MTLRDFKAAVDRQGSFRYHFKALDPEFGTVKEEVGVNYSSCFFFPPYLEQGYKRAIMERSVLIIAVAALHTEEFDDRVTLVIVRCEFSRVCAGFPGWSSCARLGGKDRSMGGGGPRREEVEQSSAGRTRDSIFITVQLTGTK